jgi:hypothetical protein
VETLESLNDLDEARPARRSAEESEPQRPFERACGRGRALEHTGKLFVGRPDVAQEPLPGRGKPNATARAVHELGAELVLEPAQALADP